MAGGQTGVRSVSGGGGGRRGAMRRGGKPSLGSFESLTDGGGGFPSLLSLETSFRRRPRRREVRRRRRRLVWSTATAGAEHGGAWLRLRSAARHGWPVEKRGKRAQMQEAQQMVKVVVGPSYQA
uniref:Uncharacterized protein n=1 Tax=Oryza rufipogon TaxID=4529 RepID=A0A0E0R6J1_ORYRU